MVPHLANLPVTFDQSSPRPSAPRTYTAATRHERRVVTTLNDFEMDSITGEPVALSTYRGQVCLVVNVASK